jgi:hypothetical protein
MIDWTAEQSDKFIGTAAAIASAIAAGAAGTASVVGAKMSSGAAKDAASSQSDAAVKAAQIQADSANQQAAIQAKTAADALQYSRGQSQLSLDQYNQQQQRLQPYRNLGSFALGQPMQGAPAPLTLPNLPGQQTAPTAGAMPAGSQSGASAGNLSDPNAWMSLVGNKPALLQWVQSQGVTDPQLAGYYTEKIQGQPGANATEQAGSANYWASKIKSDPKVGGGGGGVVAPAATAGPVKLNYTPTTMAARGVSPIAQIGTLQAPMYKPLSQIGVQ